jgi:hypothetical protein
MTGRTKKCMDFLARTRLMKRGRPSLENLMDGLGPDAYGLAVQCTLLNVKIGRRVDVLRQLALHPRQALRLLQKGCIVLLLDQLPVADEGVRCVRELLSLSIRGRVRPRAKFGEDPMQRFGEHLEQPEALLARGRDGCEQGGDSVTFCINAGRRYGRADDQRWQQPVHRVRTTIGQGR